VGYTIMAYPRQALCAIAPLVSAGHLATACFRRRDCVPRWVRLLPIPREPGFFDRQSCSLFTCDWVLGRMDEGAPVMATQGRVAQAIRRILIRCCRATKQHSNRRNSATDSAALL
jgi:hypothetical protein